jgi:hypothetical protein
MCADPHLTVPDELIEQIAERADLLVERQPSVAPARLDTKVAAEHLACSRDRIHDLVALGKLSPRRLLFKRSDWDDFVERSA